MGNPIGALRVLLVDDNEQYRTSAAALLAREGLHIVSTAATAEDALRAVEQHVLDLVLIDLRLPGMDGVDLAARLASRPGAPQAILMSSYTDAVHDPRVRDAPVLGFLSKANLTCSAVLALTH